MRKLSIVLFGLMLMTGSAWAQSAKEIYAAVNKIPTEAEIVAAVKTDNAFAAQLKALNEPIEKMEKALDDINSGKVAAPVNKMPNMMSDPDGWAEVMEKREKAQEKVLSLSDIQMELMTMHGKYANQIEELDNSEEDDSIYAEKYSMLQSKYNKSELSVVNQFFKEVYALDCEFAAKKINKRMKVIRDYYNELTEKKAKIIELDEANNEFYMLMGNNISVMTNPVRQALVEFAKLYKKVLEENHPNSLIQYKSMKEYYESAG